MAVQWGADAVTTAFESMRSANGISATYTRAAASVTITVVPGRQLLRVSDGQGQSKIVRADLDFIVLASDLVLSGSQTVPSVGDTITIVRDTNTEQYQVLPIGDEQAWRHADQYQQTIRIHAKRTA